MPTMREVAAKVGVSQKTVSRVFNEDPHVLPATREKVLRALQELKYTPNTLARDLRAGRAPVIGIAIPEIVDPFFASIVRAVDEVAAANQMSTLITSLGDAPEREPELVTSLLRRSLSGLVLASVRDEQSYLEAWTDKTPIVFVDRAPTGVTGDSFTDDDVEGGRLATAHLLAHGHTRVAFLGDRLTLPTTSGRLQGYRDALTHAGIPYDDALVGLDVHNEQQAAAALELLTQVAAPPTAVFSSNARVTMSAMPRLQALDVSLVSFGDFPMANLLSPPLTVVDQDPTQLGTLAASRIVDRLEHPNRRFRRRTVLGVDLIERGSCTVSVPRIHAAS